MNVKRSTGISLHQTRTTDENRAYHRAVATRLVILISAHDLIAASRTDGRTDGQREKKREREGERFLRVRGKRWSRREREREAEEGEEKDIERCRDVLLPLDLRSRAFVIYYTTERTSASL